MHLEGVILCRDIVPEQVRTTCVSSGDTTTGYGREGLGVQAQDRTICIGMEEWWSSQPLTLESWKFQVTGPQRARTGIKPTVFLKALVMMPALPAPDI